MLLYGLWNFAFTKNRQRTQLYLLFSLFTLPTCERENTTWFSCPFPPSSEYSRVYSPSSLWALQAGQEHQRGGKRKVRRITPTDNHIYMSENFSSMNFVVFKLLQSYHRPQKSCNISIFILSLNSLNFEGPK